MWLGMTGHEVVHGLWTMTRLMEGRRGRENCKSESHSMLPFVLLDVSCTNRVCCLHQPKRQAKVTIFLVKLMGTDDQKVE